MSTTPLWPLFAWKKQSPEPDDDQRRANDRDFERRRKSSIEKALAADERRRLERERDVVRAAREAQIARPTEEQWAELDKEFPQFRRRRKTP